MKSKLAAGAIVLVGLACAPAFGPLNTLPAALAVGALILVMASRDWARSARLTGLVAALSLTATAASLRWPGQEGEAGSFWGFGESLALIVLVGVLARWAPPREGLLAGALAWLATGVWLFRHFIPPSPLEWLGLVAFGSIGIAIAAGLGLYLRTLDSAKARALTESRLQLARDLHDFVAHDVSEMIAQAQAGLVIGANDPAQALAVLHRIEQAGQRAMASMDRTVQTLNAPTPVLADLPDLVSRFSASGTAAASLDLDPALTGDAVPREVSATAYRIVVEALTNVRRHASAATRVDITVNRTASDLRVDIVNDGVRGHPITNRGGFGLPGLAEQARALGGSLRAAAEADEWRLTASLPCTRER